MQEALTCGQWITDNEQLASHILEENRKRTSADDSGHAGGVVVPVISFANEIMDIQVLNKYVIYISE